MPTNNYRRGVVVVTPLSEELMLIPPPDFLGDEVGTGFENVNPDDIIVPRISLLQPVSPMSTEPGYQAGNFVDMTSRHNFGGTIVFVPIFFFASRIKWQDPTNISSGIECRSFDSKVGTEYGNCVSCSFSQWHERQAPECTLFKNIMMLPLDSDVTAETLPEAMQSATPSVFAAKRTATKSANEFISAAMMLRVNGKQVPLFASYYELTAIRNAGEKGVYFTPKFTRKGFLPTKAAYDYASELYVSAKNAQERISDAIATGESRGEAPVAPTEVTVSPGYDF